MLQLARCFCGFTHASEYSGENAGKSLISEQTFQITTFTLCTVLCAIASNLRALEKICLVLFFVNLLLLHFGAGFVLMCSEAVSSLV